MATNKNPKINAWKYGEVGFEFAVAVAMFSGLGYWLDLKTGWLPALTMVGLVLGFAIGVYRLWIVSQKMRRESM